MLAQDLHIHTVFSKDDGAVVPQQTVELITAVRHARCIGISDHIESIPDGLFPDYERTVRSEGLFLGAEIAQVEDIDRALEYHLDYRVFHCKDDEESYRGVERLVESGQPVIIAHPMAMGTDLGRVPAECFVEVNNRYVWRNNWNRFYTPWLDRFRFVFSSDAHQPNWLNQNVARYVGKELGIQETLVFDCKAVRIPA